MLRSVPQKRKLKTNEENPAKRSHLKTEILQDSKTYSLILYFNKIRIFYNILFEKNQAIPNPSMLLKALCDDYWQEGQRFQRTGQHDLLAKRISAKLAVNNHISIVLNEVLKDVTLDQSSQFFHMLRAFLSCHLQYMNSLDSFIVTQIKPEYLSALDNENLDYILSKTEHAPKESHAFQVLGNLAKAIPEERKEEIIQLLQKKDAWGKNLSVASVKALIQFAKISSEETFDKIIKFLIDKKNISEYGSRVDKLICKEIGKLAYKETNKKKKEDLIEVLFNFIHDDYGLNEKAIVGYKIIADLANFIPDHLKEKIVYEMLNIKNFYVPNKDFLKVYCDTMVSIANVVSDKLKEDILLNLQERLRIKASDYHDLRNSYKEFFQISSALNQIAKQMPVIKQEKWIIFCLDRLRIKDFSFGCAIALSQATSIIPAYLHEKVISTLLNMTKSSSNEWEIYYLHQSLGYLANIIPDTLAKNVVTELSAGFDGKGYNGWCDSNEALKKLANDKKMLDVIVSYIKELYYQDSPKAKNIAISCAMSITQWLPKELSEDIFNDLHNKFLTGDSIKNYFIFNQLSELALSNSALRERTVITILKQFESPNGNLRGSSCEALSQMAMAIPEYLQRPVLLKIKDILHDNSEFVRSHAAESIRKMRDIIPIDLRDPIINDLIKNLIKAFNGFMEPLDIARTLKELLPLVPKHLQENFVHAVTLHLRSDSQFNRYNTEILYDILGYLINDLSEAAIDNLFKFLVKEHQNPYDGRIHLDIKLLSKIMVRYPHKWNGWIVDQFCQQAEDWNVLKEALLRHAIKNAREEERYYFVFGILDSTIERLKLAEKKDLKSDKQHFNKDREQAILSLMQIKTEFCYDLQLEMLLEQRLPKSLTKIVKNYAA